MNTREHPSIRSLRREAIAWTAGGPGKPLVDAAAIAIAETPLNSPALAMLAGATTANADEDAARYAHNAFVEQGCVVAARGSEAAIVAFARIRAWEYLRTTGPPTLFDAGTEPIVEGPTPAQFAYEMYGMCVAASYVSELSDWPWIADCFEMIEQQLFEYNYADLVRSIEAAARDLCGGVDPLVSRGPIVIEVQDPRLPVVISRLRLDASLAETWENPTAGDYIDGVASWLNAVRNNAAFAERIGHSIEDSDWIAVRDALRHAITEHAATIDGLLAAVSNQSVEGPTQHWLLATALVAGTMYE